MTEVEKVLNKYGESVVKEMITRLTNQGKDASGTLIKSINYEIIQALDTIELSFGMINYGQYVDKGRKPGKQPPVAAIKVWTKLKGIPEKAAYPIAVNIGKYGIKPTNFWTISTTRRQAQLDKAIEIAFAADITNALKIDKTT